MGRYKETFSIAKTFLFCPFRAKFTFKKALLRIKIPFSAENVLELCPKNPKFFGKNLVKLLIIVIMTKHDIFFDTLKTARSIKFLAVLHLN